MIVVAGGTGRLGRLVVDRLRGRGEEVRTMSRADGDVRKAVAALALNVVQLASTFRWQRPLQAEMATAGFDAAKARWLVATNWIRTAALLAQAVLASAVLIGALVRGYALAAP